MCNHELINEGALAWLRRAAEYFYQRYRRGLGWAPLDQDELVSVGYTAMREHEKKYPNDAGVSFQVYCCRHVRRAFATAWRHQARMPPVGQLHEALRTEGSPMDSDEQHHERVRNIADVTVAEHFIGEASLAAAANDDLDDARAPLRRALHAAIEKLPTEQCAVMRCMLAGQTQHEMAAQLNMSCWMVRKHTKKAMLALTRKLRDVP